MKLPALLVLGVFALLSAGNLGAQPKIELNEPEKQIAARLKGLRAVPDAQRGAATTQIALDIRQLPADAAKLQLALGLAGLSTEGDFGHETLQAVAVTLAGALREQPAYSSETAYSELAQLVRYEHVDVTLDNAPMKTAMAQLEADDRDRQNADLTLNAIDGKSWRLHDLRGHVVMVNFWATWCPPCRKEMPDLDALYRQFKDKGLVILAVSDEDSAKVTTYLAAHPVSYPVLLDPDRKVNKLFHVEGIPKTFIYDRDGKLAAQSIDMRTRGQFLELLSRAGLAVNGDTGGQP